MEDFQKEMDELQKENQELRFHLRETSSLKYWK